MKKKKKKYFNMHAQGYKVKDLEYDICAFNYFNKLRLQKTNALAILHTCAPEVNPLFVSSSII